eukprot:jgi/Tetstr1/453939/TSEL_040858.t1
MTAPGRELALFLSSHATSSAWAAREHQDLVKALRLVTSGLAKSLPVSMCVRIWRPSRSAAPLPPGWFRHLTAVQEIDLTKYTTRPPMRELESLSLFASLTTLNMCCSVQLTVPSEILESLPGSITDLNIASLKVRADAAWLERLVLRMPRLEALDITSCRPVPRMPAPLPSGLTRQEAGELVGVSGITSGGRLQHLSLRGRTSLEQRLASDTLAGMVHLRVLDLSCCSRHLSLVGLHTLPALETVILRCRELRNTDTVVLSHCKRMTRLDLSGARLAWSLDNGLYGMPSLTDLGLAGAVLDPMHLIGESVAPGLTRLDMSANAQLRNPLTRLCQFRSLTHLDVSDCPRLTEGAEVADTVRCLRALPSLRKLYLTSRLVPEEPSA